jgi:hypothetical protein
VQAALARDQFTAPAHLVRAKADTIRLIAAQLLIIDAQRRSWEKRMGELLLGAAGQPTHPRAEGQPGQAFPGGEIYLSFPGLGRPETILPAFGPDPGRRLKSEPI